VELQDRVAELEAEGMGVAAISYDSREILADFSERRGITFPLLSDAGSEVINEYGLLNTVVAEALGAGAEETDVQADVTKYVSAFGVNEEMAGMAFPGSFVLDAEGRVTERFFEEYYQERNTTANVLLSMGAGEPPVTAIEASTAHLELMAYPSNASVTVGTRFSIVADVDPRPSMHVYAPGAEELGYRVISLDFDTIPEIRFEAVAYPESEIFHFEPLDERVPSYQAPFTLRREAVVARSSDVTQAARERGTLTLTGSFEYQACDDRLCYPPVSVPLSFTLDFEELDRTRANR
jgi:alkyl hydroperoxide reductase subunit AhpC